MIFETYAQRKRAQISSGQEDVYIYDGAPKQLRHQLCMIFSEAIGSYASDDDLFRSVSNANDTWEHIDRICRKEILSYLDFTAEHNSKIRFLRFIDDVSDIDEFLSGVEIACVVLDAIDIHEEFRGAVQEIDAALEEINHRFVQHGVGFQFENGQIIRIDSKLVHSEIIKPALSLLIAPHFSKANADFMTAHRHYRADEFKDAVAAANRAFESMLKSICDAEGWGYEKGLRAAELITIVRNNGLFTHDFEKSFDAYVAMLKAGLPTVRNEAGGHGEGIATPLVTAEIARFAINLTASNILFLGEAFKARKR